ncbi:ATPase family AAA domain-containing protein 2 [Lindgomyces ingoldianus]|uniref:ATPase family AAA domain-containing protein 2 n=1 Tax=Lindgomyces ingoldianus TaxID=673940 RepID=A0ACB6RBJ9_9PLEO|nr:ATPase family AAA domain-containing protein 2 [Lindgomyces ingoldianus]KAF2476477.1 ATPase family AAA domain-containing protein 2 [Lindgomyces ingoldianus]
MSSRAKRKLDTFDPNASDPEDLDYDGSERAPPQRHRKRHQSSSGKKKSSKRPRRRYRGSDSDVVDDNDSIVTDDSFTDRSSEEDEVEINPATGRSVRRAAKKEIKYEEPSSDEDEIEDTPSADDELASPPPKRKARERKSLVVVLKMPEHPSGRSLRARTGSKSIAPRGKTPEASGARRSSRLSHDVETPMVQLSDSGKHVNIIRQGTRSPEPVIARATRGGKGPITQKHPSAIMEASQEASQVRDEDSPGPLEALLGADETQVEASHEASPEHEAQVQKDEDDEDDEMEGVIQESQQEPAAEDSDDEEDPITRGGRNLRSRAKSAKRKRGADESSDFEPAAEDEKEDEMSASDHGRKGRRSTSEDSGSGSGRRSTRIRAKHRQSQRSRRNSDYDDQDSMLDAAELAEEAQELATTKRRRLNRNLPDSDLAYDTAPKLRNRGRNNVDYRLIRPELNEVFENLEEGAPAGKSRSKGGRSTYRSLFSNQGPFGGGLEGGLAGPSAVGGMESDSSDDEVQKVPRGIGGTVGMTPTTATAPGFAFPQAHGADPQQATDRGGGPANFGKVKDKKALADADPLGVDPTVNFDGVGGLDDHINKLKEMVMLPLLYPEVFQRFHVTPPRGVLFHGPPGTGKTLLARALASSVSSQGQKVTFYMRKGADALSKWVGEAERQLRLLFEEARKTQPSIIFFDEIDGLAPVRSSKQEQIHASIVATLLALMDGMDGRGQVIVIGATNRPDSVDPALRRPGRFDREFYFPLPNVIGRRAIIDIHTKNWDPPLKSDMKDSLAELTKGYGGADLRALCTEAALNAVQGTYPQIYQSEKKLLIDPTTIKVLAKDFMVSVNKMVPSSQRTVTASAAPLAKQIEPLLRKPLADILKRIDELIPRRKKLTALEEAQFDDREDEKGFEKETTLRNFESGRIFRPRLLINGLQGMGQQYLGAALLNKIEGLHVQSFDLPTILEDSSRTPESAITQLFTEVRRHKPSVIYIPNVDVWYQTLPGPAIKTFKLLLRSIGANEPILLLGVMELLNEKEKPDAQMMMDLFSFSKSNQYQLNRPDHEGRSEFFNNISQYIRMSPADFPDPDNRKKRVLPELEAAPQTAPVVDPVEIAARERRQRKQDRMTLNKLKVIIQPIMDQLKKSYRRFFKPIIDEANYAYLLDEEDPNYFRTDLAPEQQQEQGVFRPWERSKDSKGVDVLIHVESGNIYYNLDLTNIEKRLSNGYYKRPKDFQADIRTLAKDAKMYGDPERMLKTNEMVANVEVDIEMISTNNPGLTAECEAVYARELERERKAKEKREKEAAAAGKEAPSHTANVPPQISTDMETSGPIMLGEPIPGQTNIPPVTPHRAFAPAGPLSNGTTTEEGSHAQHSEQRNGSTVPSRPEEDTHMTDSQDLDKNTHGEFQTPSRFGTQTQTQKSQVSGRTFMAPNSHPGEYHNSASTTTSGQKTSDRSSVGRFNTQSTNGVTPAGVPDFGEMMPQAGGSQLPDTQEVHYISSQLSNSQPSQQSPQHSMPAPAPPRHTANIASILNDEIERPQLILDESHLNKLHSDLVEKTSGLSLEQLEQVNAALMDAIWKHRAEYNRNVVLQKVADSFNEIIADIQMMQIILKSSQEELQESDPQSQYPYPRIEDWRGRETTQLAAEWRFARGEIQQVTGMGGVRATPIEPSQYS